MTSSVAVLLKRIDRMIEQVKPRLGPKTWELLCEAGQEIPGDLPIGIYDSVTIREYPVGLLGNELDGSKCTVAWYEENSVYYVPDGQGSYRKVGRT